VDDRNNWRSALFGVHPEIPIEWFDKHIE